jgi:hypothetical protein
MLEQRPLPRLLALLMLPALLMLKFAPFHPPMQRH